MVPQALNIHQVVLRCEENGAGVGKILGFQDITRRTSRIEDALRTLVEKFSHVLDPSTEEAGTVTAASQGENCRIQENAAEQGLTVRLVVGPEM